MMQTYTVLELIDAMRLQLDAAGLSASNGYGQGTQSSFDEAAWLTLWQLGLPLDQLDHVANLAVSSQDQERVQELIDTRVRTRKPAAYLTQEAWLQGVAFYSDERAIIPRSLIAELLAHPDYCESLDAWLHPTTKRVLDLCTGNGSLAILAAMLYPEVVVDAADVSSDALAVAHINVERHQLQSRINLLVSDVLQKCQGPYDLILCNPPYVNSASMAALPPEFQAEPALALAGGNDGMDFVRKLFYGVAEKMTENGVLVLEIGHEKNHFLQAFPQLQPLWFETSSGCEQVMLLTHEQLA